ncbi:alcohol dehydrogenase catalytic domain-containing protein [Saccharopolyspora cebuensis]|uniref:alcohol dehydrogenase catalytic domain-containing protein n=1 Tax=Saccharopolyspora cebuensis TaxID=418759 RepID=UPI00337983D6
MRATLMHGAGDVRVENVPDPVIQHPTDALVRITASCICGSDLHPYGSMSPADGPARMGHEFIPHQPQGPHQALTPGGVTAGEDFHLHLSQSRDGRAAT